MLPASADPMTVGAATLVSRSLETVPLSEAADKAKVGAPGAVLSMVRTSAAEAVLVFPATSIVRAVRVWLPSARPPDWIDQLPAPSAVELPTSVAPSYSMTALLASAVPVTTGAVKRVMRSSRLPLFDAAAKSSPVGSAATVSMVTTSPVDWLLVLPVTSTTRAVRVWSPDPRLGVVKTQVPSPLAVTVPIAPPLS